MTLIESGTGTMNPYEPPEVQHHQIQPPNRRFRAVMAAVKLIAQLALTAVLLILVYLATLLAYVMLKRH